MKKYMILVVHQALDICAIIATSDHHKCAAIAQRIGDYLFHRVLRGLEQEHPEP
jgi:hypothetical protein